MWGTEGWQSGRSCAARVGQGSHQGSLGGLTLPKLGGYSRSSSESLAQAKEAPGTPSFCSADALAQQLRCAASCFPWCRQRAAPWLLRHRSSCLRYTKSQPFSERVKYDQTPIFEVLSGLCSFFALPALL